MLLKSLITSPSVPSCPAHANPWPQAIQGHQRPFPVSHLWNNMSPWIPRKGKSSSPRIKRPEWCNGLSVPFPLLLKERKTISWADIEDGLGTLPISRNVPRGQAADWPIVSHSIRNETVPLFEPSGGFGNWMKANRCKDNPTGAVAKEYGFPLNRMLNANWNKITVSLNALKLILQRVFRLRTTRYYCRQWRQRSITHPPW